MIKQLAEELRVALADYRRACPIESLDKEMHDGMSMIVETVKRLISALENDDISAAKLEVLAFSRQASDVFFEQPASFRRLAITVSKVRKEIV